ncbi:MAG: hypothetical protein LBJ82_04475 [Deltaproteobacteria bacterium]|jgi:3-hydroxymyristoyl/3-hydroxydecanoyl-(acyl carrier protein) dehydratase|nr:hypothetical protein [Deltaproteobacteria bacterium]
MTSLYHAVKGSMLGVPQELSRNVREASFFFDAAFAGFEGHFPGNPMVPGVAQIMAAVLTAAPEREARLKQIGRSKFLGMVRPGDTMLVRATTIPAEDGLRVKAECATGNGPCAQLKFVLDQG